MQHIAGRLPYYKWLSTTFCNVKIEGLSVWVLSSAGAIVVAPVVAGLVQSPTTIRRRGMSVVFTLSASATAGVPAPPESRPRCRELTVLFILNTSAQTVAAASLIPAQVSGWSFAG